MEMTLIQTLVADDHQLFRDGIKALLESTPDTDVVGEASSGEEAILQAAKLKPDVIIYCLAILLSQIIIQQQRFTTLWTGCHKSRIASVMR